MSLNERGEMCRIHLVRHGRTVMNAQVRFRGRRDVALDEVGRAEALEAAKALSSQPISEVYSSPLQRARDVGMAIAAARGVTEVRDHPGLINVDYGEWEGLTKEECTERDPELFRAYAEDPDGAYCPGGESLGDAADRMIAALIDIGRANGGKEVAAVTHGAMVRLAVLRVMGPSIGDWQFKLPTGSATVFDVDRSTITVVSVPDRTMADPVKGAASRTYRPASVA
jgi:broad specificity phosphatase PhoE